MTPQPKKAAKKIADTERLNWLARGSRKFITHAFPDHRFIISVDDEFGTEAENRNLRRAIDAAIRRTHRGPRHG